MQNSRNGRKWAALAVGLVVLAAAVGGLWHWRSGSTESGTTQAGLVVSDEATDWNKELENASPEAEGIKIPGYGELTISEGADQFQMSLVNPEDNPCYFKYTLEIAQTSDILYESDLIEPGKAITEFEIENLPAAGDYDMNINISTYTMDESLTAMNGAQVKTILHVV